MNDYKDLELQEQLMDTLEKMQQEKEQQEQTISSLLSQISRLKSEVQNLADKNVKLNAADNVLKQNEQLRNDNDKLRREKEEAENEAKTTILNYEKRNNQLVAERASLEYKEQKQEQIVERKVQVQLDKKTQELEEEYKKKKLALHTPIVLLAGYSGLVTLFRALRSKVYRNDFIEFWKDLWATFVNIGNDVHDILSFVIALIQILLPIGLLLIAFYFIIDDIFQTTRNRKINRTWDEVKAMDWLYLSALVIPWAVIAFFGDHISRLLPINLVTLHILIFGIFLLVRFALRLYFRFKD